MTRIKISLMAALFIFIFAGLVSAQETTTPPATGPTSKNYYTQLIGFKGGGELYLNNFMSDWSTGVFFETVLAPFIGLEIDLTKSSIPITNYNYLTLGTNFIGNGTKSYVEIGGGLKFYIQSVSISLGLTYNSFIGGYFVDTNKLYTQLPNSEYNFFSVYIGPELTAQISTDLFTKVGVKFIYGFTPYAFVPGAVNETIGLRFYLAFAYGI